MKKQLFRAMFIVLIIVIVANVAFASDFHVDAPGGCRIFIWIGEDPFIRVSGPNGFLWEDTITVDEMTNENGGDGEYAYYTWSTFIGVTYNGTYNVHFDFPDGSVDVQVYVGDCASNPPTPTDTPTEEPTDNPTVTPTPNGTPSASATPIPNTETGVTAQSAPQTASNNAAPQATAQPTVVPTVAQAYGWCSSDRAIVAQVENSETEENDIWRYDITTSGEILNSENLSEDIDQNVSGSSIDPTICQHVFESEGNLFIQGLSGGEPRQLTFTEEAFESEANWGPNGIIAFNRDGAIWATDQYGSFEWNLGVDGSNPYVSPDGEWVVYQSFDDEVCVVELTGFEPETFCTGYTGEDPSWSPDGQTLFFRHNGGIDNFVFGAEAEDEELAGGGVTAQSFVFVSSTSARSVFRGTMSLVSQVNDNSSNAIFVAGQSLWFVPTVQEPTENVIELNQENEVVFNSDIRDVNAITPDMNNFYNWLADQS